MNVMSSSEWHRKLSEGCDFHSITPDEILGDRMIFGIKDDQVREQLLRELELTLQMRYAVAVWNSVCNKNHY